MAKTNFLVIVVFLIISILIVNAAEEKVNTGGNETLNLNNLNIEQSIIQNNQNNETKGKAVTASFGVYLEIVG